MLTRAIPEFLPRMPSHLTEVPVKVNEAVAPATSDCTAAPPLHPKRGSAFVHLLSKLTATLDSSIRAPATAGVLSLPVPPSSMEASPSPLSTEARPAVLSPSPPPPQEITRAESNKAMYRFIDNLFAGVAPA
jgi:hypothetical protein